MIENHTHTLLPDSGRQILMFHYAGPWPFVVGDKRPNPSWAGLGAPKLH